MIFSNEISVVLEHKQDAQWVWQQTHEHSNIICVCRWWKKHSEFMFWDCFFYDFKESCHIWEQKTAQQKREAQLKLNKLNAENETWCHEKWKLEMNMQRMNLRQRSDDWASTWRFTEKTEKLIQNAKRDEIDWYRYYKISINSHTIRCIDTYLF